MSNRNTLKIFLIGNGNLAHSFSIFFEANNISFEWFKPDEQGRHFTQEDELDEPVIYLCAVNESNLNTLFESFNLKNSESLYLHFSGSMGLVSFPEAIRKNSAVLHPMQTFPNKHTYISIDSCFFTFQGVHNNLALISESFNHLLHIVPINISSTEAYHLMGVFSSNFLPAIVSACVDLGSQNGLKEEETKKLILPLMKQTLRNIENETLYDALSGPLKRNEKNTLEKHERYLKTFKESYFKLYGLFNRILKDNILNKEKPNV